MCEFMAFGVSWALGQECCIFFPLIEPRNMSFYLMYIVQIVINCLLYLFF